MFCFLDLQEITSLIYIFSSQNMGNGAKFCGIWHIFLTKMARNFFLNGKKLVGKMQF
jgi:hypothetical protein